MMIRMPAIFKNSKSESIILEADMLVVSIFTGILKVKYARLKYLVYT